MKNKIDKKAVGRRIREIRISKTCTLEEFGNILKAGKSNVRKWEIGDVLPNKERQKKLAKLGQITINELLYGDTEKDIQELYEQIIKLPKEDVKILLTNVVNYLKENNNVKRGDVNV